MSRRDSLARGAPPAETGTLHARSAAEEVTAGPEPGRVVRFGRAARPGTDLRVGPDDRGVSRRHGELAYRHRRWWLRNTGQQPFRLPRDELLHPRAEPAPLAAGYTPLFVRGFGYREHLVELYVSDGARGNRRAAERWPLAADERLLLVVLGQRYLRHESAPRPLRRRQALEQLRVLRPYTDWESPGIEHRIAALTARLIHRGGSYGRPCECAPPLHGLLEGLVGSATLVPPDLALLDGDLPEGRRDTAADGHDG
ncbi:FHA domain-containing protein [Streptomyces armeniacus]|uniref:FHA domain-containing protein n=1 Tax=Streptomyces armeniacus TaxID=83291 RepID=A0A345XWU1_9ACTN|nr:FHA domain-containing protein [Streptomyces armeniacus]AXK36107.1 FHA domain-containing protein [Streptomyces armeniacus]